MKRINTSLVSSTNGFGFTPESLNFVQDSYKEIVDALIKGLVNYTSGNVIILYGCVITGTNPGTISNTTGAVYYNGEVYLVDAQTFTTTGANISAWTIDSQPTSPADPAVFFSNVPANIHFSRKFKLVNSPIGGSGITNYICDYNSIVIKYLTEPWLLNTNAATLSDGSVGGTPDTISSVSIQSKKVNNIVFISGQFTVTKNTAITSTRGVSITVVPTIPVKVDSVNTRCIGVTAFMTSTDSSLATGFCRQTVGQNYFRVVASVFGTGTAVGDVFNVGFNAQYETI